MLTRPFDSKTLRRHFSFVARRWKLRVSAALYHWASPEFNPFLSHELRRLMRRKNGPLFILWPLLLIGIALALIAQFRAKVVTALDNFAASERINSFWTSGLLGAHEISLMALIATGICGYATLIYSQRATRILLREHNSGTFNQLLLWPLSETRIALLTSAPAAASAMALWFLLLPLWLLSLATNQWSWREFFGVPLLFLIITIRPPEWTPLHEEYNFAQPTSNDSTGTEEATKNVKEDFHEDPNDEAPSIVVADPRHQPLFNFDPAGIITLLVVWQIVMFIARNGGLKVPPTVLNYLLPQWHEFLPDEVWNLLPSILFSWPLFLIQLLMTPLPFFGIALPLCLWLAPRLLLDRYAAFSTFRLSYLGSHSLQFRRWGRYWREAKRAQAYLFWFFASGFLWPWLISQGALAAVLPGAPLNASAARAGLWTILIIIATWSISARLHSVLDTPFKKATSLRRRKATLARWRRAWRKTKSIFFGFVSLYFALCWLGGTSGMDAVWRARLLTTILTMAAYLLADFSALALKNALPERYRTFWSWLRFFWFWGLFWETVFRVVWAHYAALPFDLSDATHVMFSPFVSLLALLDSDIALPLQGALWQLGLALLVFTAAAVLMFQKQSALLPQVLPISMEETAKEASFLWRALTTMWRIIWFAPGLILRIVFWPLKTLAIGTYPLLKRAKNVAQPFLARQDQELWRGIDSFDNPILRHDLRLKRQENLCLLWLAIVAFQGMIFLILLCLALIKPLTFLFYGGITEHNRQAALNLLGWRGWGDIVFGVTMAFGLLSSLGALFSHAKVFDKERANGGMVFLFLTPLSESEIIGGYIGSALLSGVWFHSALYPSILLASLLEIIAGRGTVLLVFLLLTILLHAIFLLSATTSIWGAVRAKNAGEGGIWVLFFGLLPQAFLVFVVAMMLSSTQSFWAQATIAFSIALCLFVTRIFWLDALRRLRRERFGDVSLRGTVAN